MPIESSDAGRTLSGTAMSLTSMLRDKSMGARARSALEGLLPKTEYWQRSQALVPSRCAHPQLVGVAFDYAARFELSFLAKHAIIRPWIPPLAVKPAMQSWPRLIGIIEEAVQASRSWPENRTARFRLMAEHAAKLAPLECAFRSGQPPSLEPYEHGSAQLREVAEEVERLLNVASPLWGLASSKPLLLNPTFGAASEAVGGADADIIAGDCIIDIKTTSSDGVDRQHLLQLVGYAALATYHCVRDVESDQLKRTHPEFRPRSISLYFARHARFVSIPLRASDEELILAAESLMRIWNRRAHRCDD